jgi:RimJ/RimL family protein N-acetyltransferase
MQDQTTIRPIQPGDAMAFLDLKKQLDRESKFMLLEPQERNSTLEEIRKEIEFLSLNHNGTILVAETENQIAGYLSLERGTFRRIHHTVYLVTGILQKYWKKGIGSALLEKAIYWCRENRIQRIELTVLTPNTSAIALYKKFGFEKEGVRKRAILFEGKLMDEYYMAKLL